MRFFSIDGNVGSGKSTFLEKIKSHYAGNDNIIILPEPVSVWDSIKDKQDVTMLQKFYADQQKYAFSFQMMAYISRLALIRDIVRKHPNRENLILISERCLYTDKHVFAKMLYDQGKIEDVDFQIYMTWFDEFAQDFPIDQCIYIKTDPMVCHERVKRRARPGEDVIPLEYLVQCDIYHEAYILTMPKVSTFDGNIDIFRNEDHLQRWLLAMDNIIMQKM
jgi:deoxyadenosine/deoxycytidine kinase